MFGMEVALRLSKSFDPASLQTDLEALAKVPVLQHFGPYHDGRWGGLALVAPGGRFGELDDTGEPSRKTELLNHCPYFNEVIDGFRCDKKRVRLLTLAPGGRIYEHRDPNDSIDFGVARVHIPIVTHADVVMVIAKRRYYWRPGELWYADFSFPHWVNNRSPITRVHLVLDLCLNDFVRSLFPPSYLRRNRLRAAYRSLHHNWYWYVGGGRADWYRQLAARRPSASEAQKSD
jgi:hypothetical protein